jgi:hypothetical protein
MNRIMTIISLVFLIGCSIIFYENYVDPRKPNERVYVDTCYVDTVKTDSLK